VALLIGTLQIDEHIGCQNFTNALITHERFNINPHNPQPAVIPTQRRTTEGRPCEYEDD
jgi:hypothetical protein